MTVLTRIYPNGFNRQFIVTAAAYANEDGDAVILTTQESGAVAISVVDTPDLWEQLIASDIEIAAYEVEEGVE